jgi:hypothetical protein
MSKFGVGVGDEFPVDDGNGQNAGADQGPPRDDRAEYEEWKRRREAHHAQREQWRAQREEWRQRKQAFKEKIRAAARESFGDDRRGFDDRDYRSDWRGYRRSRFPFFVLPALGLMIPILFLALLIAIVAAIFKAPFLFLALVLGVFLLFGFRPLHWAWHAHDHGRGHRYSRYGRDDGYDFDLKPTASSPPASPPSQTPPQAPQDGGK